MRVLLIGHPIAHSLSPTFQNAAFAALGLPHHYELHPIEQFDRRALATLLADPDLLGANVTVPHKEVVAASLDGLTDSARRIGAVNTLFRGRDGDGPPLWLGDNTDEQGFVTDLEQLGLAWPVPAAVVLGAGGAARAVVSALLTRVDQLALVNRTPERAHHLVESLTVRQAIRPLTEIQTWNAEEAGADPAFRNLWAVASLIVDATSLREPGPSFLDSLPWEGLSPDALCYDLKYTAVSPFLDLARAHHRQAVTGLGMLLEQGALAFERWTGQTAPRAVMRASLGGAEGG